MTCRRAPATESGHGSQLSYEFIVLSNVRQNVQFVEPDRLIQAVLSYSVVRVAEAFIPKEAMWMAYL